MRHLRLADHPFPVLRVTHRPTLRPVLAGVLFCALSAGCQTEPAASSPPVAPPSPYSDLNAMDPRAPVPLQPMMAWHQKQQMQDHLKVIQEVVAAASRSDWSAAETAAKRMGTSPEMAMTCDHMGKGADGFTEQALEFHRRADAIAEAARNQDSVALLEATAHTLAACTACHDTWRQDVVTSDEWSARTGGATLPH